MRAAAVAADKKISLPLSIVFSGRLVANKRVEAIIEAVMLAVAQGVDVNVTIVGDGPQRDLLERKSAQYGVSDRVRFVGALPFEQILFLYYCFYSYSTC